MIVPLLLTATLAVGASTKDPKPALLDAAVAELTELASVQQRVLAASARLLGATYAKDPLGEGPGHPDADPRLRLDAVDCQTYVETVLALAAARSVEDVERRLNDLRYDGEVAFARRHHYFEAQWLEANVRKGYVRPATRRWFAEEAKTWNKSVTLALWKSRPRKDHFQLPDDRAPIGDLKIDYIPLETFRARARDIPSGAIFAVVREDRPNVPHMVTHMGFVVQRDGKSLVRHAGRSIHQKVVDEPLADFVRRHAAYRKWKVLGVMLLEVLPPPEREGLTASAP